MCYASPPSPTPLKQDFCLDPKGSSTCCLYSSNLMLLHFIREGPEKIQFCICSPRVALHTAVTEGSSLQFSALIFNFHEIGSLESVPECKISLFLGISVFPNLYASPFSAFKSLLKFSVIYPNSLLRWYLNLSCLAKGENVCVLFLLRGLVTRRNSEYLPALQTQLSYRNDFVANLTFLLLLGW